MLESGSNKSFFTRKSFKARLIIYSVYFLLCFGLIYLFEILYRDYTFLRFIDDSLGFALITFSACLVLAWILIPGTIYQKVLPAVATWLLNACVIFPISLLLILSRVSIFEIPVAIYSIFGFFSAIFIEFFYRLQAKNAKSLPK